jgi:hypothetical protein
MPANLDAFWIPFTCQSIQFKSLEPRLIVVCEDVLHRDDRQVLGSTTRVVIVSTRWSLPRKIVRRFKLRRQRSTLLHVSKR